MTDISATKISQNLIRINERDENGLNVDAWLVLGNEKAALIDSLQENEMLYEMVKSLTDLPLEVIVTHGHPDHAGKGLHRFLEMNIPIFMNEKDRPLLKDLFTEEELDAFQPVKEGMVFDLGKRKLEIISCAGHTPGSMCALDWDNRELFTGDAIGSGGLWMQLPESLYLTDYMNSLLEFRKNLVGASDLRIFPGHIDQARKPMTMSYLDDLMSLVTDVLTGKKKGEPKEMTVGPHHISCLETGSDEVWAMLYKENSKG